MSVLKCLVLVIGFIISFNNYGQCEKLLHRTRFRRLPQQPGALKQRLREKIDEVRQKNTQTICYDAVGCFELPHKRSPLQKIPENPDMLNTRFYLYRRNLIQPEIIYYDDDGKSLESSKFNYSQPLKMLIHGYLGKWSDKGNQVGADSYLKIYDCNMIVMDWSIGARGPHYVTAAANTEIVGRQLGILLLAIVKKGLNPKNIHLIGFSLGAHVAGTSSEVLKKHGFLIGRITGLDAASPLFRTHHLRERHKKLDKEDAHFVDVIHTDASPSATDGFGLWEPIGHVDFFPNGGQEQPGCTDTKQSIVVTHFERNLTLDIACSHIRASRLFQETILNKAKNISNHCEFIAFSCPGGLTSFENGDCFPRLNNNSFKSNFSGIGRLGEDTMGEGVMFLTTKSSPPYCGTQIQTSIHLSEKNGPLNGLLRVVLHYSNYTTHFEIHCDTTEFSMVNPVLKGLTVVEHDILKDVKSINSTLKYYDFDSDQNNTRFTPGLFVEKIVIRDMHQHRCTIAVEHRGLQNLLQNLRKYHELVTNTNLTKSLTFPLLHGALDLDLKKL